MLKLWKTPVLRERILLRKLAGKSGLLNQQKFNFSAGGHGDGHSGSGSEHDHDDHSEHHEEHHHDGYSSLNLENYNQEIRSRIFRKSEGFSVDKLLYQLNEPLQQITVKPDASQIEVYKSNEEYINFLAESFERKALEKYPEYKSSLNQYKHLIPNYDSLNNYAKEVYSLDTYLHWKLEVDELQIREAYNFSGSSFERANQRVNFFKNIIQEDHHHDTNIMHHLKVQLKNLLEKEKEFEDFKNKYNEEVERKLIHNIVEKRKKTLYYEIVENKQELNRQLFDLNSEGNRHKFVSSATPHDHIHPQHYNKDPEKLNEEKWKYLAYFDIILDQHLRQIRPSSISESEEMFKYVKDEYKPFKNIRSDFLDNMYYDYLWTLDNEFYQKFKEDIQKVVGEMNSPPEVEDKVNRK
jgi:hypothetical protein